MRTRHVVLSLLIALACTAPFGAQSFLGTIRGTVVDPQGGAVKGAAVLITDEATNTPRSVDTDAEGRYEAANLKPGTYRVEVVTPNFKKFEQTERARARRRHGAGGRHARSGRRERDGHGLGRGSQQHHARQPGDHARPRRAAAARPAAQLPRHPVVPAAEPERRRRQFDDIQFLGGQHLRRVATSRTARRRPTRSSAPSATRRPAWTRSRRCRCSRTPTAPNTAASPASSSRPSAAACSTAARLLRLQQQRPERADLQPDAGRRRARTIRTPTRTSTAGAAASAGRCSAASCSSTATTRARTTRPSSAAAARHVPTAAMRAGDFRGTAIHPNDPATGEPFPDQMIPADRIDPSAHEDHELLLPAAEPGHDSAGGFGVFQQFVPETRKRQRADLRLDQRGDARTTRSSSAAATSIAIPTSITFEAGNALTNLPILDSQLNTASVIGGWTKISRSDDGQRVPRRLQLRQLASGRAPSSPPRSRASSGIENAPSHAPDRSGSRRSSSRRAPTGRTNIADAGRNVDRTLNQNAFSISDNLTLDQGRPLAEGRRPLDPQHGARRLRHRRQLPRPVSFNGAQTGNAFTRFPPRAAARCRAIRSTNRGPLDGHSNDFAVFVQDDWKVSRSLTVFLGLRYEIVGIWHEKDDLLANFIIDGRRPPRRAERGGRGAAAARPDRARTAR